MAVDFDSGLKEASERLLELSAKLPTPIVLIDGRAGSGKSLFATKLAENYFAENKQAARIVRLDDLYPGWEGLIAGSVYARERILEPISAGKEASWQIWDWEQGCRGATGGNTSIHKPSMVRAPISAASRNRRVCIGA